MDSMMQEKPNLAEAEQQRQGAAAQQRFMQTMVGGEGRPGAIPLLNERINQMANPNELAYQRGKANVGIQQQFSGAKTLRDIALAGETGSGVGRSAMRSQFSGLAAAREQAATGVQTKAKEQQEKARISFAKVGQGMGSDVISGLNQLGSLQASAAEQRLKVGEAAAERSLNQQVAGLGALTKVAGLMAPAIGGNFKEGANGSWEWGGLKGLGQNLATIGTGGIYKR
jgi:hypothetical protein